MKKPMDKSISTLLMPILLMAVLILSITSVYAHEGSYEEHKKECTIIPEMIYNEKDRADYSQRCLHEIGDERDRAEKTSDDSEEDTEKRTGDRSKVRELVRERVKRIDVEKAREDFEEMKAKYREAKEKYAEAKELYNAEKAEFKKVKERAKKCASDTEDCKVKKLELKKGVAKHLLKTNELIARSLEKLTNRVQNSNVLTEEQKAEALASIEELEASLTAEKERVTALAENATNAELREAIQNLKHTWQEVRKEQRRIVNMLIGAKLGNLSERLAQFGVSMQQRIDQLKADGKDTTELEALYADFAGKVEALRTAPATEAAALLREAKELLREFKAAEEELKESAEEEDECPDEAVIGDQNDGKETTICHIPPENPANKNTIVVGTPAVKDHLAHGDVLGSCACAFTEDNDEENDENETSEENEEVSEPETNSSTEEDHSEESTTDEDAAVEAESESTENSTVDTGTANENNTEATGAE